MSDLRRALELGRQHHAAGVAPFGDLADAGSALLMDALGQAGPTTQDNHYFRMALCEAYTEGLAS